MTTIHITKEDTETSIAVCGLSKAEVENNQDEIVERHGFDPSSVSVTVE
jgi:hypothetical protein